MILKARIHIDLDGSRSRHTLHLKTYRNTMRSSSTSPDPKGLLHSRGVKHCHVGQQRAASCRLSHLVTPLSSRRMPGREDPCPHLPAPKSEPNRFAQRCRHPKSCLHLWDSPGSPAFAVLVPMLPSCGCPGEEAGPPAPRPGPSCD